MNEKAIRDLAREIVCGNVLTSRQVPDDLLPMVFLPLMLGGAAELEKVEGGIDNIGLLYGYYKDAGPSSINGYPSFFSIGWVLKDDLPALEAQIEDMQEALA